jgi:hypothetical protein
VARTRLYICISTALHAQYDIIVEQPLLERYVDRVNYLTKKSECSASLPNRRERGFATVHSKDAKTVEGFVIGVGGFLGIGEKSVALKMDRLQMSQNPEDGFGANHGREQGRAEKHADLQVQEGTGR